MIKYPSHQQSSSIPPTDWGIIFCNALRIAMGILWAIVAVRIWSPDFAYHLRHYHETVFQSQPGLLMPWFGIWTGILWYAAGAFVWIARVAATLIAALLLIGMARKTTYIFGAVLSLLLWTLTEGFVNVHAFGAFNLSAAIICIFIFICLIMAEGIINPLLQRKQIFAVIPAAILLTFLISGAANSLNLGHPPSPDPLQLAGSTLVANARDATLPPLLGKSDSIDIKIDATDNAVQIASGIYYRAMTYNGVVPAPTIHVRQGQRINVTFTNYSIMPHSIDFHAAMVNPDEGFANISPGEELKISFVAEKPGAFSYHCGTPPTLLHIANGMYGAIIVDPIKPLPTADVNYVIVQSEWYTQHVSGNTMMSDYVKMLAKNADLVTFNGVAFQYRDHPLTAKPGQRVRFYFVNAGPNLWSEFHIIGSIFDKFYPSGNNAEALTDISSHSIGPGAGGIFDVIIPKSGSYSFVDHSMADMEKGAMGILEVKK